MASLTRWTSPGVWASSRSWWWTGKPGVLQSMGLQRFGHDWGTELNWPIPLAPGSHHSIFCLYEYDYSRYFIQYLSFRGQRSLATEHTAQLFHLTQWGSRFIHNVTCTRIFFPFYWWIMVSCTYVYHVLFIHSSLGLLFSSVQFSHLVVSDSVIQWTAAHQASLSITNSRSLLKLMSIESVMSSNHLILCHSLLFPPSIFPSIRVLSNESVLCIR